MRLIFAISLEKNPHPMWSVIFILFSFSRFETVLSFTRKNYVSFVSCLAKEKCGKRTENQSSVCHSNVWLLRLVLCLTELSIILVISSFFSFLCFWVLKLWLFFSYVFCSVMCKRDWNCGVFNLCSSFLIFNFFFLFCVLCDYYRGLYFFRRN